MNVGSPIEMSCSSSTDDHQIERCDWTVDGQVSENTSTVSFTPDEVRDYNVVLSVTDLSGNTGNATAVVKSVDPTVPRFDLPLLAAFPTAGNTGEALTFEVAVSDAFDADATLQVHWDLQPLKDTDNNGNAKDDPDRVGLRPSITFDDPGLKEIVVTVFDESNNSANYAFSIDIAAAPEDTLSYTGGLLLLGGLIILVAGGLSGNRAMQRNKGFNLLIERGLNQEEARAHMAAVAQRTSLSFLSKAVDYAGLALGEVVSEEERLAAHKQAEMDAIYGSANTVDPNAGFAQAAYVQAPLSDASKQAASEAAALFSDEPKTSPLDDSLEGLVAEIAGASALDSSETPLDRAPKALETPAVSLPSVDVPEMESPVSAVALPAETSDELPSTPVAALTPPYAPPPAPTPPSAPAPVMVQHTCSNCNAVFELDVPAGVQHAVVACPACAVDQSISVGP